MTSQISVDTLKKLLICDFEAGTLTWLPRDRSMFKSDLSFHAWNKRFAGKEALATKDKTGYFYGPILGKWHKAHRVIWAMKHGYWPPQEIDHINGDGTDNRLENLRAVSPRQNRRNQKTPKTNTSGVLGVYWCKPDRKWKAQIKIDGRKIHLGAFSTIEDAAEARAAANVRFGFHENHGRAA
jgi:hypothetical protein